jgi:hypothetical protein
LNDIVETGMTQERLDRVRRLIVALACAFNVLSVLCLEYQDRRLRSVRDLIEGVRGLIEDIFYYPLANSNLWFELLVNYGIWLAPTITVLLLRKYWAVATCYALVFLPILLGRIYYALPGAWTGDSGHHQKGDWASWAMTLVGTASAAVIAIWVAVAAIWMMMQIISLANGRGIRRWS